METTPLLMRPKKKKFTWSRFYLSNFGKIEPKARNIRIGRLPDEDFPQNYVCNQKYNVLTFLPMVLFEQFSFFLNLIYLIMALSQFIPSLRIGYLYTYWFPLCFVVSVSLIREAVDDFRRFMRDREVNKQRYERVIIDESADEEDQQFETEFVPASALRVGDIVMLHKGQRVPADMILLRTADHTDTVYVRTDQLDGEIDWKVRVPVASTQKLHSNAHLLRTNLLVFVDKPVKDIHTFIGSCSQVDRPDSQGDPLDISNTLLSGCVIASGQATGLVIYTGYETRNVMNNSMPRSKICRSDRQVNDLTKVLFVATIFISFFMIVLKGFNGPWYAFLFRFVLLFSYIIPISLRVNLEIGKAFYSWTIQRDKKIQGTVMRSTKVPEELGRIQYLLADKTGTLTKNEMVFQKLQLGNQLYDKDNFHEVEALVTQHVTKEGQTVTTPPTQTISPLPASGSPSPDQMWRVVLALALCHNVTPVYEQNDDDELDMCASTMSGEGCVPQQQLCEYQASSPDEVALVKWTDMMGISLYERSLQSITLKLRASNVKVRYNILQLFPFTSETKMMGIIVQNETTGEIACYVKGADVAFAESQESGWLRDECRRLAAEGLRTLLVARKTMTQQEYDDFETQYTMARLSGAGRASEALDALKPGLTVLAITGIEDRLADDAPATLAKLKAAGIKIWMLTGDKLETAECIARSLRLGVRDAWLAAPRCVARRDAHALLQRLRTAAHADLIIEGETLEVCLAAYEEEFVLALQSCASVVVARCSPTQKARVARLLRARGLVVAAVGDGGNDVAMIREADIGIGVEGVEGRAASLAGDVSIPRFACTARLALVHGRRSYLRSAALSLFIVHRGIIVSTMQAVFSVVFYFSSVSLYPGFLMVGYGTIYTTLPVLSLVLDKDIPSSTALNYPHLYKQLSKGRQLSYKTFYIWTGISIYQGGVIMYGALVLFEDQLIHIVEISYTALLLTELIMIALTVRTWHPLMLAAELSSLVMYAATLLLFTTYFDLAFLTRWNFWWKVTTITLVSCLPLYVVKYMHKKWTDFHFKHLLRNTAK